MELKHQRGIITGGSDGIGLAMATLFAEQGASLWLIGRNEEKLKSARAMIIASHDVEVEISSVDLADRRDLMKSMDHIKAIWPEIDFLVNNAGTAVFKGIDSVAVEDYDHLFNLNVQATVFMIQSLLPAFNKEGASIINISSYFSDRIIPGTPSSIYSATKGAINSLTKALSVELGPGIRVNAIAPGTIETALVRSNFSKMLPERKAAFDQHIQTNFAMKTIGQPKDVAEMALFLSSAKAKWITGGIFAVDGGLSAT